MSWDDVLFEETSLQKLAEDSQETISFKVPKALKKELDTKIRKKVGAIGSATAAITRNRVLGAIAKEVNRKIHDNSLQKTAGLFMKPSDIADHTNLAGALEGMLSGSNQGTQFKHAGVNHKVLVGAGVGAVAGAAAHFAAASMEGPKVLKVDDVQGFGNKLRHRTSTSHHNFVKNNPKTSLAVHTTAGAVAGGTYSSDLYDRYKRVSRSN